MAGLQTFSSMSLQGCRRSTRCCSASTHSNSFRLLSTTLSNLNLSDSQSLEVLGRETSLNVFPERGTRPRKTTSFTRQLELIRKNGKLKRLEEADSEYRSDRGAPGSIFRELQITPAVYSQAIARPIQSRISYKPNQIGLPEWKLVVKGSELGAFDVPRDKERKRANFVWVKQTIGVQDQTPPALEAVGLFALPVIDRTLYETSRGSVADETEGSSKTTADWLNWCWLRLGNDLAGMGSESAKEVNVVEQLNALFASNARPSFITKQVGMPRLGSTRGVSPFRVRKRQYEGARSTLTWSFPSMRNKTRLRTGIVFPPPPSSTLQEEYDRIEAEAIQRLHDIYADRRDLDKALEEWAVWMDKNLYI